MFVVAANAGQESNHLRAIAAQDEHQGAAFDRDLRTGLQIVEAGNNFRQVAGALVFLVVREETGRTITVIRHLVTDGLEFFGDSRGAQSCGSLLAARGTSGGARRRANQGNLLRLTDDFDRQGLAPCVVFPFTAPGYRRADDPANAPSSNPG